MRPVLHGMTSLALAGPALGQIAFFTSGDVPGGDAPFQSVLHVPAQFFTFDSFSQLQAIDRLSDNADISIVGDDGTVLSATARVFYSEAFNSPGRFYAGSLLGSTADAIAGGLRLDFTVPVEAVGAWMFDDGAEVRNYSRLTIVDALGRTFTSPIVDGNTGFAHGIDGFAGAISAVGIVSARFDGFLTGDDEWTMAPELDYIQIGAQMPQVCHADLNHDGLVEDADFSIFVVAYNLLDCADPTMPPGCPADFNADGAVDDSDFVIFVAEYNRLLCP